MLSPSFVCHENKPKSAQNGQNQAVLSDFEIKNPQVGVQNQKMPQVCVGTNVFFDLWSKLPNTAV
jgi:hypothetical protein